MCWFFGYKQFNYLAKSFGLISVLTKANGALDFKMKKQNSSLSLHNFLNENIPNLVNLREKTEKRSH